MDKNTIIDSIEVTWKKYAGMIGVSVLYYGNKGEVDGICLSKANPNAPYTLNEYDVGAIEKMVKKICDTHGVVYKGRRELGEGEELQFNPRSIVFAKW